MSIEYFVEGKVISKSEGDYLARTKGNISHSTQKEVRQNGKETGVSYNKCDTIHPADTPVNTIDVSLNLFFDGTQNNKTNTEAGKNHPNSNHKDDSFNNDYSNVARGFDAIDPEESDQIAIYVEGIGTEDLQSESIPFTTWPNNLGIPLGTGPRGIKAKVSKGCRLAGQKLRPYAGKDFNLIVNVYGFSRGAAAARHFVHIATQSAKTMTIYKNKGVVLAPYDDITQRINVDLSDPILQFGYFGACLLENGAIPKNITFNFAGLYDTVAAYGLNHRGTSDGLVQSDTEQLGLTSVSKSFFILQIAADDEYRDNFDLTDIKAAGVKGLQFTLPGAHSDIGGSYVDGVEEVVHLCSEWQYTTDCQKFRDILIEEGWYLPKQLQIINATPEFKRGPNRKNILVGTRTLRNTYDKLALNTMFNYSSLEPFGVKYKSTELNDHQISEPFLQTVSDMLKRYMNSCNNLRNTYVKEYNKSRNSGNYLSELEKINYSRFIEIVHLKELRNKYLHWSASVSKLGLSPRVRKAVSGTERKRNIQDG